MEAIQIKALFLPM